MNTERIGVIAVQEIVYNKLDWIFREQPIEDFGIDAQIEVNATDYPTGKLIALQIKSGKSYFAEADDERVIFRFEEKHYQYWRSFSLPVIIVLYNPEDKECIWETVDRVTVQQVSANKYKIVIRKDNRFDEVAKIKLLILAYQNNIEELASKMDKLSVDVQYLFSALNDVQKERFLKAKQKNDEKNMSAYSLPLELDISALDSLSKIKKEVRKDKIITNVTTKTVNKQYYGKQFMESYNIVKNFLFSKNRKIMVVLGDAGVGKTTLVRMIQEKHGYDDNIIFLNKEVIDKNRKIIDEVKAIHKKIKSEKNTRIIIIDGWDELFLRNESQCEIRELFSWINKYTRFKVIITSRYLDGDIDKEIDILKMYPFSEDESFHYLYSKGIINKDTDINNNVYKILRVYNTPLLLNLLIEVCQNLDLSIEKASADNILISIMLRHSNEESAILERLAYEMMYTKSYSIIIKDENALNILGKYEELITKQDQVSFVHKVLFELYAAQYIFKLLFLHKQDNETFEKNACDVFANAICSVEILGYIKFLIKHEERMCNKDYIEQLNNNFYYMIKKGMVCSFSGLDNLFERMSNIFYSVWHLVSYANKNYYGGFQLHNSEENSKYLAYLIDVFNRVYFDRKYLDFSYTDITYFKLWRCNLINVNFTNAKLQKVSFLGSCLNYSNFENADMSYCNLNSANLRYANMRNVKLLGANVSYCMISEENLKYFLPYKDTLKGLDNLIIFKESGEVSKYAQYRVELCTR